MRWTVSISAKAERQSGKLPERIRRRFFLLLKSIRESGPARRELPHYGKLRGESDIHHCHLNKGRPTYVAVWRVVDRKARIVEATYVGTHENAPY